MNLTADMGVRFEYIGGHWRLSVEENFSQNVFLYGAIESVL